MMNCKNWIILFVVVICARSSIREPAIPKGEYCACWLLQQWIYENVEDVTVADCNLQVNEESCFVWKLTDLVYEEQRLQASQKFTKFYHFSGHLEYQNFRLLMPCIYGSLQFQLLNGRGGVEVYIKRTAVSSSP